MKSILAVILFCIAIDLHAADITIWPGDVKAWTNIDVYALREAEAKAAYDDAAKGAPDPVKIAPYKELVQPAKEPDIQIEQATDGVSGKRGMRLTFAGGRMPTIAMKPSETDWTKFKTFKATVTASRTCLVVFRVMCDKSQYGTQHNDGVSRWEFAARCEAGKNLLVTAGPPDPMKWKNITSLEIYMYNPHLDESIIVDAIELSSNPPVETTPFRELNKHMVILPAGGWKMLGTNLVVKDVDELAEKLKDKWTKPEDKSAPELEADFRSEYDKLKKDHPKAAFMTLRDGDKGCDPKDPSKVFSGWMDAGTPSHGPMSLTLASFRNSGKSVEIETCFRARPGFLRVDLSSIPKDATILAARLILVRGLSIIATNWETKPTLFVAEPCRREWNESEVNCFEYAKDQFWKDYSAQSWGEDGDCDAVMLAHGPAAGKTLTLDFAEAVKYWTVGRHENHGFIIYGSPKYIDYFHTATRESPTISNRPALLVIYEPK